MEEDMWGEDNVPGEPQVLGDHVAHLHEAISQIQTPGWPAYVKAQAGKLLTQLGVSSDTIMHPELVKLVLYRHHKDQANVADSLADTAAMMVIVLPSQFKEGDLIVFDSDDDDGDGDSHCLQPDAYTTSCMVFFKGFNYELLDVEGGSKLALIYRLVQRSAGPLPVFQDNREAQYTLYKVAQEWEDRKLLPKRAIHMLDNKYGYHGGLWNGIADLIGRDQAVATALMQVHACTDLEVYLAFVTMEVSGSCTDAEVSWTADRWQHLGTGGLVGLKSVDINAEEIMQGQDCFAGVKRDSEDEYTTGRYVPTHNIRRTWQQAALVVWPRCHSNQLLCDGGQAPAVAVLNNMTNGAVWGRRQLAKAAAQLTSVHADELAAAMAAAAEATVPNQYLVHQAHTFADAVWTRFSIQLLRTTGSPHKQFVHLIHELGMVELALKISDRLKETQAEHAAKWHVIFKRSILNEPTHGLCYPGPEDRPQHYQKLDLTPSTAKELSLLAELVGWSPFLPIMLDMASRPDDPSHCINTVRWTHDLQRTRGGFKALQVLAKQARGPGGPALAELLPKMAVAVAQTGLQRKEHLFKRRAHHFECSRLPADYQRFVLDIAYIVSALTTTASEDSKSELKALHDSFVKVYMKQPEDYCYTFFHKVIVPACETLASCSKYKGILGGCPILQSLMQACIARLEELTRSAPQEPKDWALDDELRCDIKDSPSAANGMCMNCNQLQAFLKDGSESVFITTLSKAEAEHLEDTRWRVRNADFKQEGADGDKEKVTITKVHCAYEKEVAKHAGYLDKIAALKRSSML
ncbi:hypothetical protein ABBQ38_013506 [Trebouxia sp. C0009 RCD-2024]